MMPRSLISIRPHWTARLPKYGFCTPELFSASSIFPYWIENSFPTVVTWNHPDLGLLVTCRDVINPNLHVVPRP